MADRPLVAGVELGGAKCLLLLASGPDDIRDQARIDTTTPGQTLAAVEARLRDWRDRHGFGALGLASFGPLELDPAAPDHGRIVGTPKPGWDGVDLLALGRRFGVPVGFDTDVNAAALAEGRWGGARGLDAFAYVTVGTGIGVGSIVAGRPIQGLGHSEAGHMRTSRPAGATFAGVCPFHGDCAEGLASGPAIRAVAGVAAEDLAPDHPAWDEVVHVLAAMFHNLVVTTAPRRILLGGGVGMGQPHLLPRCAGRWSTA